MKIQLTDIFKALRLEDYRDKKIAREALEICLSFLVYIPVGGEFNTSTISFKKLSDDIIHMESIVDSEEVLNSLEIKKLVNYDIVDLLI